MNAEMNYIGQLIWRAPLQHAGDEHPKWVAAWNFVQDILAGRMVVVPAETLAMVRAQADEIDRLKQECESIKSELRSVVLPEKEKPLPDQA